MLNKKRIQGLMAQSLYEELDERNAAELARALENSPELRHEYDELRQFTDALPAQSPDLNLDLTPLIRTRLQDAGHPAPAHRYGWRMAAFSAACVTLIAAFGYTMYQSARPAPTAGVKVADTLSPVQQALQEAERLVQAGRVTSAYEHLNNVLSSHPDEPLAPQAQRMMADLAYEELQRYEDAQKAYRTYRDAYRTAYTMDPNNQKISRRLDMLAEAEKTNFEPLYAIHRARERGEAALGELEQVVARNPSRFVAEEAMLQMARILAPENTDSKDGLLEGLQTARASCSDPLALDQFDYAIGRYLHEEFNDSAAARSHLEQAADSDDTRVAAAAKDYLRRIGSNP